jgi:hypothetical protein
MAAAVLYLSNNGFGVKFTNNEYEEIMLCVVNDKLSVKEIERWLSQHSSNGPED